MHTQCFPYAAVRFARRAGSSALRLLAAMSLSVGLLLAPAPALAANYAVTKTADTNDGSCSATDCSLREAIAAANADSSSTVTIPAGTYTLTAGELGVSAYMTITGAGASSTIIDANKASRVLHIGRQPTVPGNVGAPVVATISGVTIRNGTTTGDGGGILMDNNGTLTVSNSTISGNSAANGGGIYAAGSLTLRNSTISGNSATSGTGGGIYNSGALTNSASVTAVNSTIANNSSVANGSAIYNGAFAALTNVTVSNSPGTTVAALQNDGASLPPSFKLTNSIISNPGGKACSMSYDATNNLNRNFATTSGHNLISDNSCVFASMNNSGTIDIIPNPPGNIVDTNLNLGSLANNGGPTPTIAVAFGSGSQAIDAGDDTVCAQTGADGVNNKDQRGFARPQRTHCDIGAYEAGLATGLRVAGPNPATPVARQPFSVTVTTVNPEGKATTVDGNTAINLNCNLGGGSQSQTLTAGQGTVTFSGLSGYDAGSYNCSISSNLRSGSGAFLNIPVAAAGFTVSKGYITGNTLSSEPVAGQPFNVTVTATDSSGNAFALWRGVNVSLAKSSGANASGALGGTLSGGIPDGQSSVTISGLTYSQPDTAVVLQATASDPGAFNSATSAPFAVQGVALSIGSPVPASPVKGQAFSVTVTAVGAADNQPISVQNAVNVTLAKSSGAGVLGGNLSAAIPAGQSSVTFSGLTYSTADPAVALQATANGFASATGTAFAVQPSFKVTNMTDSDNGAGACPGASCSLRDAISAANGVTGGSVVEIPTGTYTLTAPNEIAVTGNLTIKGAGVDSTTLTRNSTGSLNLTPRVFNIGAGASVTIEDMTIEKANNSSYTGDHYGGAILNAGNLTLQNARLNANTADRGGAIYSTGTLTIANSSFTGNSAALSGGGIVSRGSLTVSGSTFSGSKAGQQGGGIAVVGSATVANSTFSGNTASANGGGVYNASGAVTLTVINSTFSGNGGNPGGAIFSYGTTRLTNSIVAGSGGGNCVTGGQFGGTVTSGGNNLSSDGSCGGQASDKLNTDPKLDPLANNGGPTQTMKLQTGSPAIGAGNPTVCAAPPVNGVDQRGTSRPATACDIGAYEH